ncbi:MAG: hypothetical protein IJS09_01055, partial [Treponema sp.]|nr:hypothetical protein [Treponema sp.]
GPGGMPLVQGGPHADAPLLENDALVQALKDEISLTIKESVSHTFDEEVEKSTLPLPADKEKLIKNIVSRNLAELEQSDSVFIGPDKKIYICGHWLLRQVPFGETRLPCIARLKQKFYRYNTIEYRPDIIGSVLREEMQKKP